MKPNRSSMRYWDHVLININIKKDLYNSLDALGIEFNIGPIVVVKKYKSVLRKSNGTLHLDRGTFGVYPSEWVST